MHTCESVLQNLCYVVIITQWHNKIKHQCQFIWIILYEKDAIISKIRKDNEKCCPGEDSIFDALYEKIISPTLQKPCGIILN